MLFVWYDCKAGEYRAVTEELRKEALDTLRLRGEVVLAEEMTRDSTAASTASFLKVSSAEEIENYRLNSDTCTFDVGDSSTSSIASTTLSKSPVVSSKSSEVRMFDRIPLSVLSRDIEAASELAKLRDDPFNTNLVIFLICGETRKYTLFFFANPLNTDFADGSKSNKTQFFVYPFADSLVLYGYYQVAATACQFRGPNNKFCSPRMFYAVCPLKRRNPDTDVVESFWVVSFLRTRCSQPRLDTTIFNEAKDEISLCRNFDFRDTWSDTETVLTPDFRAVLQKRSVSFMSEED